MNLSQRCIRRPVATVLLAVAIALCGLLAWRLLPVAPLPQVDYPTIEVDAGLPGASPETMAASVATPLERALGSIPGLLVMESSSSQGSVNIEMRFDLGRDIDDAARDVQAAINAARGQLPSGMPGMPSYRKVNPSQAPIMALALTSTQRNPGALYDLASTLLAQKLAQIPGVGQVEVGGSSLPAVRVSLDPNALNHHGVALDTVAGAIGAANRVQPLGAIESGERHWRVDADLQLRTARQYRDLIVAWRGDAPIRLGDVATVAEGVENRYSAGFHNDRDAVLLVVSRQAGANIIATVDAIHAQLPALRALLPADATLAVAVDRSPVIRATLHEAQLALGLAIALVVLVVAFLGDARAAIVPTLAIPVVLLGTLGVMHLAGFSLNNLSLMALIIAAVLVVDDAIVVLENIARHIARGLSPMRAAVRGASEVATTLLSMNLALAIVFVSVLFMDDFVERLFREFSLTLVAAMAVSLLVALSLTPTLAARLLRVPVARAAGRASPATRLMQQLHGGYARTLEATLRRPLLTLGALGLLIGINLWLFDAVPKGLVPRQDTGQLRGFARGDDGLSFRVMQPKLERYRELLVADPAIEDIIGYIGGGMGINNAYIMIKPVPLAERGLSSQQVIDGLRERMPKIPGGVLWLWVDQDLRIEGGSGDGEYEFELLSGDTAPLREWTPRVREALAGLPELADVQSSGDEGARQIMLDIDRDAAARLGVDVETIARVLDNSFSQRQVATRYDRLNQYRVVMELDPKHTEHPGTLERVHVIAGDGRRVPLSTFASMRYGVAPDRVNHKSQFAATSISFALAPGVRLEQAATAIDRAMAGIMLPDKVIGRLAGEAGAAGALQTRQAILLAGVVLAVYLLLGMLYESWLHPLTILSTLPSAGLGALLALHVSGGELNLISMLGLFLLVGVVMKNTILMTDFALAAQRRGLEPAQAVREAALLRFRPILMTSIAALLGSLPLLLGGGEGWELRRPLGVAIVGGLVVSQLLTLYTTPAVFLAIDRLRRRGARARPADPIPVAGSGRGRVPTPQ